MRRPAPRTLGPALEAALRSARPSTPLARVQAAWRAAAGELVAEEAEPTSFRDGTLTLSARSSVWAQELELMSSELVERLTEALDDDPGAPSVRAIRVVMGHSGRGASGAL